MAVTPVRTDNGVALIEMGADGNRVGFLTRIQVGKARNLAIHDFRMDAFFEFADRLHGTISVQQCFLWDRHGQSPWTFYLGRSPRWPDMLAGYCLGDFAGRSLRPASAMARYPRREKQSTMLFLFGRFKGCPDAHCSAAS